MDRPGRHANADREIAASANTPPGTPPERTTVRPRNQSSTQGGVLRPLWVEKGRPLNPGRRPPACRYSVRSRLMWSLTDVIGLLSNNVGSFSRNVVPRALIFSANVVPKPLM